MSWAGSEAARVYLGQHTAGVVDPLAQSPNAGVWLTGSSFADCLQRAVDSLAAARWRKRKVRVLLSGALARPFMMSPIAGLKSWRDAAQVAASLAPDATGLAGPCEVWLGDWMPDRASLAVAIDAQVRQSIESTARGAGVRLTSVEPWWATTLRQASQQSPSTRFLAAQDTDSLTVLTHEGEAFSSAASYAPSPQPEQIDALFARLLSASAIAPELATRATLQAEPAFTDEVQAPFAARWSAVT